MMVDNVVLVSMPWQALESPSLPLGLLRSVCRREGLPVPTSYHGGVRWCEHLMEVSDEEIGVREYTDIAENGLFDGIGDWVFTGVLHDDPDFGVRDFTEYAAGRQIDLPLVTRMREHAAGFIERVAEEVLALRPRVVGFTTTFMQNVPSLAPAKRLKAADPDLVIAFGGGTCDGDMGAALHRNSDFVDVVARGEGEHVFPQLLRALAGDGALADVPGLCWRDGDERRVNSAPGRPVRTRTCSSPSPKAGACRGSERPPPSRRHQRRHRRAAVLRRGRAGAGGARRRPARDGGLARGRHPAVGLGVHRRRRPDHRHRDRGRPGQARVAGPAGPGVSRCRGQHPWRGDRVAAPREVPPGAVTLTRPA